MVEDKGFEPLTSALEWQFGNRFIVLTIVFFFIQVADKTMTRGRIPRRISCRRPEDDLGEIKI